MSTPTIIRALLQQASVDGARSTAVKPIGWALTIILASILGVLHANAPAWTVVVLFIFATLTMGLYLFSYLYLLFRDRDALRSERYSLRKLEIEKGLVGDSLRGMIDVSSPAMAARLLDESTEEAGGHRP